MLCDRNMSGFWICQGYTRFYIFVSMLLNNHWILQLDSNPEPPVAVFTFRFRACFEQGVPWHSGNYRVWIHPEMRTWHDKNIQSLNMSEYRHIRDCSRAYSRLFRTLCIPGIFRTQTFSYHKAYWDFRIHNNQIHNIILNIFTKAPSWTFDTVLNAPVFYKCYLTYRITLRYL